MATLTINTTDGTGWGTTLSGSALTAMNAVWAQAVSDLQTALVPPINDVTITITRQYSGSNLGSSSTDADATSYAAIRSAYLALTPSNSVQTNNWTTANIPSTAPTTELGTFMQGQLALSVAIGRTTGSCSNTVTLGSGFTWDTSSVRGDTVSGSGFTAYGVIMHELTECLGRGANANSGGSSQTMPMDNFVFSAPGVHCTTQATTRYISAAGGGVTPILYNMDTNGSDDAGDTAGPNNSPAFAGTTGAQAIISRSSSLPLQAADWQMMTLIGWNLSATGLVWAGLNSAPVNSVLPSIGGTLKTGNTLTVTPGTWSNSPILTYQWKKNGSTIGGATSTTYTPTNSDRDASFSCNEIANAGTDNVTATAATVGPWLTNSKGSPFGLR